MPNLTVYDHLKLLGMPVKDRVTGATGVVTSVSFDLYGCIQAIVHPGLDQDGKAREQHWFDVNRLQLAGNVAVMPAPDYAREAPDNRGPAEKPPLTAF